LPFLARKTWAEKPRPYKVALTSTQRDILTAIRDGGTLKIHRDLDGDKQHVLHPLDGEPQPVDAGLVESLRDLELIQSNLKFPAATYLLTDRALQALSA
jgi:hypothetical protein